MKRSILGLILVALIALAVAPAFKPVKAEQPWGELKQWRIEGWKVIETDVVTIIFPAGGRHPIFIWYYNKENATVHVVHFKGIWDYFTINMSQLIEFRRNLNFTAGLVNKTIVYEQIKRALEVEEAYERLKLQLNATLEKAKQARMGIEEALNATEILRNKYEWAYQIHARVMNMTDEIENYCHEAADYMSDFNETLQEIKGECAEGGCDVSAKIMIMNTLTKQIVNKLIERIPAILNQTRELNVTILKELMLEICVEVDDVASTLVTLEHELNVTNEIIIDFFGPMHYIAQQVKTHMNECRSHIVKLREKLYLIKELAQAIIEEADELDDRVTEAHSHIEHAEKEVEVIKEMIHEVTVDIEKLAANYTEVEVLVNVAVNVSVTVTNTVEILHELNTTVDVDVANTLANKVHVNVNKVKTAMVEIEKEINKTISKCHEIAEEARHRARSLKDLVAAWAAKWHPPLFHFASAFWDLTDVGPIKAEDGTEIGIMFTFKLTHVPNPNFKFLEDNLMVRCRFYFVPVEEVVNNVTYTITKAELKMDFVLSKWEWILDEIKAILEEQYGIEVNGTEGLALWIDVASLNAEELHRRQMTLVEAAENIEKAAAKASVLTHVDAEGKEVKVKVNVEVNATKEYERPLPVPKEVGEHLTIELLSEEATLGGFFRFINIATITYPNGTKETVNVKAAYLEAGGFLRLFICYPYFNGGILEHDPSIGLEVEETTTPEATTPIYTIEAPTGGEVEPGVALAIMTATPAATQLTVAQGETLTIEVSLKDAAGEAVEAATVKVTLAGTTYTATEIEPGVYSASIPTEDLAPGEYVAEVEASKEGYTLAEASVNIVIEPRPAHVIIGLETVVMTAVAVGAIATAIIVTKKRAEKKV
ncbi:MAG: hypothetical protein DRJ26_03260 [Candidatus Methanomethylicota archaeon]|uniref:Uncharacterized protein n=1 Tax=Thermoproteota archaeon TaxID=2056631 RepID=A0A497F2D9_9CREN|nr:MAG: hypothetical protein DRJ26_03260 [Candidatus Verstraetearchaeota archaeon]